MILQVQMKTSTFDPIDPNSILNFLATFKQDLQSNGKHEEDATRRLKHFMTAFTAAALVSCLHLESKKSSSKLGERSLLLKGCFVSSARDVPADYVIVET